MAKLKASDLRHRLKYQARSVTVVAGEDVETWVDTYVWAEITTLRGRELDSAMQRWGEVQFKIRMRYQRGLNITVEDRLVYADPLFSSDRVLDILGAEDPDGTRWEFCIYAKEIRV